MSIERKVKIRKQRRAERVRSRLKKQPNPRVSVFRSLKQVYAQIIDDVHGQTVVSCSSLELKKLSGDKKDIAKAVGKELAKRAVEKGVTKVNFDRGEYQYHGRVKALAEGLREGGLQV